jgi:hypothetical protein
LFILSRLAELLAEVLGRVMCAALDTIVDSRKRRSRNTRATEAMAARKMVFKGRRRVDDNGIFTSGILDVAS